MHKISPFFKIFFVLLLILGAALGIGLYYLHNQLPTMLKEKIEHSASRALYSPLQIEELQLKYLDNKIILKGINIYEAGANAKIIIIPEVVISLHFFNLIGSVVEIDKVEIYSPRVELRNSASKLVNLTMLKKFVQKRVEQEVFKKDIDNASPKKMAKTYKQKRYIIRKLEIYDMHVVKVKEDNSFSTEVKIEKIAITDIGMEERGLTEAQVAKSLLDFILYNEKPTKKPPQSLGNDIRVLKDKIKDRVRNKMDKVLEYHSSPKKYNNPNDPNSNRRVPSQNI